MGVGRLILIVVGIFLAASLLFGAIGFACGWARTGVEIVSPANVKSQYRLAYSDWNALEKLSDTICIAVDVRDRETDPFIKSQRESQVLAYQGAYNRVAGSYNARMQNLFEARIVRPRDLPANAPSFTETVGNCA